MTSDLPITEIFEWDVTSWSWALPFWESHLGSDLRGRTALEIGSRGGGLSLWLALRGASVVCSDVELPGPAARDRHRQYGVGDRIEYTVLDAAHLEAVDQYDVIAFKSVLGAVGRHDNRERQREAILAMHRALKPGGWLVFAENLVGSPLHAALRRAFVPWGDSWRYVTLGELRQFLHPFTTLDLKAWGFLAALGRTERQRRHLSSLDIALFNRIVPAPWRYIAMAAARKAGAR